MSTGSQGKVEDRGKEQPADPRIGSRQDGEKPGQRSDTLAERSRPGRHGDAGNPAWNGPAKAGNPEA